MLGAVHDEDGQGASTAPLTVAMGGRGRSEALAPYCRSSLCRAVAGRLGELASGELSSSIALAFPSNVTSGNCSEALT